MNFTSENKVNTILLLKQALHTIKLLKEKQKSILTLIEEPIAVVGMSCRFPGGCDTPEKFWKFIKDGKDGVREVPVERFKIDDFYDAKENALGKMYLRQAGFLEENIADFDARFFNISPREAASLDPQQRLLLELSWESLENAGIAADQIKGARGGIFIGMISSEYAMLSQNINQLGPYSMTGILPNLASGRIAHYFGLHGPALTIDTACSSSLVAIHLACESLQRRECDIALAGGVSLMVSPASFIMLCQLKALAKDGRCKSFDANANGYGRGEGGGIIVLKRLSIAQKDRDNILAVIKGSAINHDGHSSGLTVPNGFAQQELIKAALSKAGLKPNDIDYLETHGTGTPLGDPIEIQAINEIFANEKSAQKPLYLGTVKANIGHLEAAAGIAGVIKSILCLQHELIPPHINLQKLNPRINLEKIPAVLPNAAVPWLQQNKIRATGVSSFGFSGTNAHIIIAETPLIKKNISRYKNDQNILTISAYDKSTLKQLAKKYLEYLVSNSTIDLGDICYTSNTGRVHFPHRAAFLVQNNMELQEQLNQFVTETSDIKSFYQGVTPAVAPKIVFVFTENTEINVEQTLALYKAQPAFRVALNTCEQLFQEKMNYSILKILFENNNSNGTINSKALIEFSVQYALSQMWLDWGVRPLAMLAEGSSVYITACIANIMSLEKAVECIANISQGVAVLPLIAADLFAPKISIITNETGIFARKSEVVTPRYWHGQQTKPVNFEKAIKTLSDNNFNVLIAMCITEDFLFKIKNNCGQNNAHMFLSMTNKNILTNLTNNLADLYCLGANIDWQNYNKHHTYKRLSLPTYPFQRKAYWLEEVRPLAVVNPQAVITAIQGQLIPSPLQYKQFEFQFSVNGFPELKDTHNTVHLGYFLEMITNAVKQGFNVINYAVIDLEFLIALTVRDNEIKTVQLILSNKSKSEIEIQIYSKAEDEEKWILHVRGILKLNSLLGHEKVVQKKLIAQKEKLLGDMFYQNMKERGVNLGDSVRWLDHIWFKNGEAIACFKSLLNTKFKQGQYLSIPLGIWDACAQLFHAALTEEMNKGNLFMVTRWSNLQFNYEHTIDGLWCYVKTQRISDQDKTLSGSFKIFNTKNQIIAQCDFCEMRAITVEQVRLMQALLHKDDKRDLQPSDFMSELVKISNKDRVRVIENYLQQSIAKFLNMACNDLPLDEPMNQLGMDSLIGLEIKSKLHADLNVDLPIELMLHGPTIKILTGKIIDLLLIDKLADRNEIEINDTSFSKEFELIKSNWIMPKSKAKATKLKIFCFPYGGAGASLYHAWQKDFPKEISIIPIQLPGRENRIIEQPIDHIETMIDALEKVLASELTIPFAIYGHSMGALIAFRLAQRIQQNKRYCQNMRDVFVGGYSAPILCPNPLYLKPLKFFKALGFSAIPKFDEIKHKLDDIIDMFVEIFAMDRKVELIKACLPTFLADLKIVESYTFKEEDILDIPITAFHGEQDNLVQVDEMQAWQKLTTGQFNLHVLQGDHFFLHKEQAQDNLIKLITSYLKKYS